MTEMTDKVSLDQALIERLSNLVENKIITNEKLLAIVNSLERDGKKNLKKRKKAEATQASKDYRILSNKGLSYTENEKIWGQWSTPENSLSVCASQSNNQVFSRTDYNFRSYTLRGLSVAAMAKQFPDHNWGCHINDTQENMPGVYLISLDNPLTNLSTERERELHPANCSRLDLNLTCELLLTLSLLGKKVPERYYRTTFTNGHGKEICVGLIAGKISFLAEDKAGQKKQRAICLVKDEKWMVL